MRRQQRLRQGQEFATVFRDGEGFARGVLAIRVVARGDEDPARFGFAVGKRIGNAVMRNRIKRRLRAVALDSDVASGMDIVVIARNGAQHASFQTLEQTLHTLLARAGAMAEDGS